MRAKSELSKNLSDTAGNPPAVGEKDQVIRFRNYKPYDSSLVVKEDEPLSNMSKDIVEAPVVSKRDETDVIKKELAQYNEEELNIVPKKANWDLKCQIEGKLIKLKRKTQRAIVDIMREKLAEKSDDEDDFEKDPTELSTSR
jgi:coiled-coil domain-containing protein 12